MANSDLVRYVREQTQKGISLEKTRENLKQVGWKEVDVDAAIRDAGVATQDVAPPLGYVREIKAAVEDLNRRILKLEGRSESEATPIFRTQDHEEQIPAKAPLGSSQAGQQWKAEEDRGITEKGGSVETKITGKWFAGVGVIALLFGVGFFLKYVFDNNLIGETGRVIMGVVAGAILLLVGDILSRKEKYRQYSFFLSGGGLGLLYLSIYGAFNYYHLISQTTAFLFMIVVTAAGAALALLNSSPILAGMSLIGGFLTPFLVSIGADNQVSLFTYILILNLSFLGISIFKKWMPIYFLNFFATYAVFFGWFTSYYDETKLWPTMYFLSAFFLVFLVAPFLRGILRKIQSKEIDTLVSALNAFAYFGTAYGLLNPKYHDYLGFFFAAWAAIYLLAAYALYRRNNEDKFGVFALGGVGLALATVAVPIQLQRTWITIAWGVEALILTWAGFELKSRLMRLYALGVFAIAIIRLFFFDLILDVPLTRFILFGNSRFLAFVTVIVAMFVASYLYRKRTAEIEEGERSISAALGVIANLLAVTIFSLESTTFFEQKIQALRTIAPKPTVYGRAVYPNDYGSGPELQSLRNLQNLSLSIIWGVYSAGLMLAGILWHSRPARMLSLLGFVVVVLKVFLYDVSALLDMYRILSFITLGIILLVISFLFYRYKEKIKEFLFS